MKEMMKNVLILFVITVVAGGILGTVYEVTKEPIKKAEEQAKMEAYREVFKDASDFEEEELEDVADTTLMRGGFAGVSMDASLKAKAADGTQLGYVFVLTSHEGYGGDIQIAMGVRMDGTTNGISILQISETPGLGMEAEPVLKPQFTDKKAKQFEYTKSGASSENEIDAISGATVTTKAVTSTVNAGLFYFHNNCKGGAVNE